MITDFLKDGGFQKIFLLSIYSLINPPLLEGIHDLSPNSKSLKYILNSYGLDGPRSQM